jgi:hypothetical protein
MRKVIPTGRLAKRTGATPTNPPRRADSQDDLQRAMMQAMEHARAARLVHHTLRQYGLPESRARLGACFYILAAGEKASVTYAAALLAPEVVQ